MGTLYFIFFIKDKLKFFIILLKNSFKILIKKIKKKGLIINLINKNQQKVKQKFVLEN